MPRFAEQVLCSAHGHALVILPSIIGYIHPHYLVAHKPVNPSVASEQNPTGNGEEATYQQAELRSTHLLSQVG